MSLIAPLSLLFGLLAVPIILLYMLRLRRQEVQISSTMLWRQLLRDREANAPWQRLRRNLLLLIQLLILALLVFALARPFLPVSSVTRGSVVVLLDGSASMLAREGDGDRFDLARKEVERAINDLSGDSQMTLILVADTPEVLASASGDRPALRAALAQAAAQPVIADWPAAMALAAGAVQGFQDGWVVVVSDGGLPEALPVMPAEVIYVPVGTAEENLAISALSSRDSPNGSQLFASVTNYGRLPQEALFNLALDGELYDARRIQAPAEQSTNLSWDLPDGATVIGATLSEIGQDNLTLDNIAWTVHEVGKHERLLLLSEGNRFLETALSVLPGLDVFAAGPEGLLSAEAFDDFGIFVVDAAPIPGDLPPGDMLLFDPQLPADDDGREMALSVGDVFTNTQVVRLEDSPLLRFVDWSNVNVRAARQIEAPWARPLVMAEGGPLLLAGEWDGRRVVIFAFRLQESDLPLQIAFPIVMANIMDWLDPGGSLLTATDFTPGLPVRIDAGAGADAIVVRKPDGALWTQPVDGQALVFSETDQPGLYEVLVRDANGERPAGHFAVNLMSEAESRITPAAFVLSGSGSQAETGDDKVGQRELWPWLALMALLVLIIEWWTYHRGARLPNRDDWYGLTGRSSG